MRGSTVQQLRAQAQSKANQIAEEYQLRLEQLEADTVSEHTLPSIPSHRY